MGSEANYWLRGHEGERNNWLSKIQLVDHKYRNKTTLASKTRFSRYCFGFQSRRLSLLVGYNIWPSSTSTNRNAALINNRPASWILLIQVIHFFLASFRKSQLVIITLLFLHLKLWCKMQNGLIAITLYNGPGSFTQKPVVILVPKRRSMATILRKNNWLVFCCCCNNHNNKKDVINDSTTSHKLYNLRLAGNYMRPGRT